MELFPAGRLALLVAGAILGCGGGGDASVDAAMVDGSTVDAEPGPGPCGVSVLYPPADTALEDIAVLFSAADGTLLSQAMVDNSGSASFATCPTETLVTLLMQDTRTTRRLALSYGGIMPGHTIVVGAVPATPPAEPTSTFSVDLSDQSIPADAATFRFRSGPFCEDTGVVGAPLTSPMNSACLGDTPSNVDVLAEAVNAGGDVVGYDFATDVAVVTGGVTSVALDGWELAGTMNIDISNISPGLPVLELTTTQSRDGVAYLRGSSPVDTRPAATTYSETRPAAPAAFIDRFSYFMSLSYLDGTRHSRSGLLPPAGNLSIDLAGAGSLPRVTSLVSLKNPQRPAVTLYPDGPVADAKAISIAIAALSNFWAVIIPAQSFDGTFVFPELPQAFADYLPTSGSEATQLRTGYASFEGLTYDDFVLDGRLGPLTLLYQDASSVLDEGQSIWISTHQELL